MPDLGEIEAGDGQTARQIGQTGKIRVLVRSLLLSADPLRGTFLVGTDVIMILGCYPSVRRPTY